MPPDTAFEPECRAAIDGLRAALIELYASVNADPTGPQDVARRFGVNKTLAWNVSKVMTGTDAIASIPNLPGALAFQTLVTAIERGGGDPVAVDRVRNAVQSLDRTVERHVGDRGTLELIVDGLGPSRADHLELSRKLAFRGNSGLLGVQAKTRLMSVFLAPNHDDPERIDMAIVRGYIGLRRLRSNARWPIFQTRGWGHERTMASAEGWRSLEAPDEDDGRLPLLADFSSVGAADLEVQRTPAGLDYLLAPGPIGNVGAVDCFLGDCSRAAAPAYRTALDTTGEFGATISAPTERLIFDIIAHERLDFALRPDALAFAGIFMDASEDSEGANRLPLPVPQTVAMLPGRPPVVATPTVPRYPELVQFVHQHMGWRSADFLGCRYELAHPPLGSTVLLRFRLPMRG